MSSTSVNKLERFRAMVEQQQQERVRRRHPGTREDVILEHHTVHVYPRSKYWAVDIGTSGRYLVDKETETIYGIKGYGKVHKGHVYGTLSTIDEWYWGDYYPLKKGGAP